MNRLSRIEAAQPHTATQPWWRGAAIYQVYPRSFMDANGDGIGDLPGVTARLDYIAALGVDAIWISPFFTSPMKDFGYDVADYCDVDPIFGTLADFDTLVTKAHALGLKVLIDQVYAHTSDEHAWFAASRASRSGDLADWYVWADPKADGSPPSNWQSVFGGPAWTWDARRGQYYLHNFLPGQPQLNCHVPAVQDALLDAARFWLDRGVDGFRLDALNFAMHDPALTDNPPAPDNGKQRTRPFDYQQHLYNQSHPDIVGFIERIRTLCDDYGAVFTMAEVGGNHALDEMHAFTAGDARRWSRARWAIGRKPKAPAGPAGRLKTTTHRARYRAGARPISRNRSGG
jgi:alpha-glucosidase